VLHRLQAAGVARYPLSSPSTFRRQPDAESRICFASLRSFQARVLNNFGSCVFERAWYCQLWSLHASLVTKLCPGISISFLMSRYILASFKGAYVPHDVATVSLQRMSVGIASAAR
jgi:hypothetical protein